MANRTSKSGHRKRVRYRVQSSREQLRRKRKSRKGLYFVLFGFLTVAVLLILCNTVLFSLETVVVEGNSIYTEADVRAAAGLTDETNLWRINPQKTARTVYDALPQAEQVFVKKRFPDTLVVTVQRPEIEVAVAADSMYAVISGKGRLLGWQAEIPEGMTEYVGIPQPEFSAEGFLLEGEEQLQQLNEVYGAVRESDISGIVRIEVGSATQNFLYYYDRLQIRLGTVNDLEDKLLFVRKFIADDLLEGETGTVNIADPRTLIFNPDEPAEPQPEQSDTRN